MKKNILFSIAISLAAFISAQNCQPVMPNVTYKVYDANATHSTSGDLLWVCEGLTIEISGDGNTAFIEKNCNVTLSGDNNTIYVKRGGSLDVTGNNNPKVLYETGLTFADNGTGNSPATCDTLFYDYTNAPQPPAKYCNVWASVNQVEQGPVFGLYPNPAHDILYVEMPSGSDAIQADFYSTTGQLVRSTRVQGNEIEIADLKKGLYLVIVRSNKKQYTSNISIE
jgi:hypothetical protein